MTKIFNTKVVEVFDDTQKNKHGDTTGDSSGDTRSDIVKVLVEYSHHIFWGCFTTREYWAKHMRIGRSTIYRWELSIIKSSPKIARLYYDGVKRIGKEKLDDYQRFLLCYIYALKNGHIFLERNLTNEEVVNYLNGKDESGKPRCFSLTREEIQRYVFENY